MLGIAIVILAVLISTPTDAATIYADSGLDRTSWEAVVSGISSDPFDNLLAQSDILDLDSGIQSVALGASGSPTHLVTGDEFQGMLRTAASPAPGYLTITWVFPTAVSAFGADFFDLLPGADVSVEGTFDAGFESFVLTDELGSDTGFFGIVSTTPFTSLRFIANGSVLPPDQFRIDNAAFVPIPEPSTAELLLLGIAALAESRKRKAIQTKGEAR